MSDHYQQWLNMQPNILIDGWEHHHRKWWEATYTVATPKQVHTATLYAAANHTGLPKQTDPDMEELLDKITAARADACG